MLPKERTPLLLGFRQIRGMDWGQLLTTLSLGIASHVSTYLAGTASWIRALWTPALSTQRHSVPRCHMVQVTLRKGAPGQDPAPVAL